MVNSQMKRDLVFQERPGGLEGLRWTKILRRNHKDVNFQAGQI